MLATVSRPTFQILVVQLCFLLSLASAAPTSYVARTEDVFDVVGFGTTHQYSGDICKFDVVSCEEPRLCRDAQLHSCTAESKFCICLQQGFTQCSSSLACLPGDRCATTLLSTGPTNLCISCNVIAENTNFSPVDDGVDRCPMTPSPIPLQSVNSAATPVPGIEMSPSTEPTDYLDAEPTSSTTYTAPSPQSTLLTTPSTPQPSSQVSSPSASYSTPKASTSMSMTSGGPVASQSPWSTVSPSASGFYDESNTNSPTDDVGGTNGSEASVSPSNNVHGDSTNTSTTLDDGNEVNNTGTDPQPSNSDSGNMNTTETTASPVSETSSGGSGDGETPSSGDDGTNTTDTSGEELKSTVSASVTPGDSSTTNGSENTTDDNTAQGGDSSTNSTDSAWGGSETEDDGNPIIIQASISPDIDGVYPDGESDSNIEDDNPQPGSNSSINICIAIDSLKHLSGIKYVFKSAKRAAVLCDHLETCATPSHIVIYKGQVLTMGDYCGFVDGGCTRKIKLVNSPKMESGLRLVSRQEHLVFTAFAAQFNTRIEKLFFRGIVNIGL